MGMASREQVARDRVREAFELYAAADNEGAERWEREFEEALTAYAAKVRERVLSDAVEAVEGVA